MELESVEAKITPRTKAILPVDLYGQMVDRELLNEVARRHRLKVIVDSAQAIGASQRGRKLAEQADAVTLSFYPTKNLGAYGDGGMILTNDDELASLLRSLRGHGTEGHKYCHVRIGYCSRLDAVQASVLLIKLPHLPEWTESRRKHAALYRELLSNVPGLVLPGFQPDSFHVYHQFTLRHARRDELQTYLKAQGIDSETYYPVPIHLQPAYTYLGNQEGDFPHAERVAKEALSIPIYPELTEEQLRYVAHHIVEFLK